MNLLSNFSLNGRFPLPLFSDHGQCYLLSYFTLCLLLFPCFSLMPLENMLSSEHEQS